MSTLTYETDDGFKVSVSDDRYDFVEARLSYRWTISVGGEEVATGDDLRSGSGREPTLAEMLATLLGFFGAYAESLPDGENATLFPEACREVAEAYGADMFSIMADEVWREDDD